jgi:long-chain acyl-CoA synthetase
MNIAGYLAHEIKKYGKYEQFIYIDNDKKVVLTNTLVDRNARDVAGGLRKLGVAKADVVGVMVSNIPEIPELMNGILRLGAVFLPIIFMLTPKEIRYILEDSQIRVLITEKAMMPKILEAVEGNSNIQKIIVVGEQESSERILSYADFKKQAIDPGEILELEPDNLAILMYTSGSTGFPKGVMLSHGNLIWNITAGCEVWPSDRTDRFLITVPMNHIYGCAFFLETCMNGSSLILVNKFNAAQALDIITDYKITVAPLVPTMITMMMEQFIPGRHDLQSMRRFISAGAPLAETTLTRAKEMFGISIYHGYGLTEASSTVARQRPDRAFKTGSVGRPMSGVATKLVDDENREVPRGGTGEIIISSPSVMKGYWNKPKETAESMREGWFHTGDLGRFDEDGELYIVGRKKDLIIKGGENIDPGVSENILAQHPAVSMAATVAIPDAKYGEEVGTAVILKPGQKASEEELLAYAGKHLHYFVAPKRIFILDSFPQTGTGKILKREIRKIVQAML